MRAFAFVLLCLGAACHNAPLHYGPGPRSEGKYPTGDAAGVYRAVLRELYISSGESPPMVVLWDSARYGTTECWREGCGRLPPHHSKVSEETIDDFLRAIHWTSPLRADFGFALPVRLLSESRGKELEVIGRPISDSVQKVTRETESNPFWLGFRKAYPGAWGYTVFSRVGFDRSRRQALVQVMHRCSSSCDHTEDIFLEKSGDRWLVSERMLPGPRGSDWVDVLKRFYSPNGDGRDTVSVGSLRYLGPDAQYLNRVRRWNDSIRTIINDSLARDLLPRRISGTIRSRKTGKPIPFAQAIAHVLPNDTKIRVVSDSVGRYVFRDLPVGGTMIEVQCPGAKPAEGKTLDAPGLFLRAGMDTVIDAMAPDISPCWDKRTIHRLTSGWFESKEALTASTPDRDESDIYKVAIKALQRRSPEIKASAIYAYTAPRCEGSERCGSVQLPRLQSEGLVDAVMIGGFRFKTQTSVAINPSFPFSLGLDVVTPQEIAYYAEEANPYGERHAAAQTDSVLFASVYRNVNGRKKTILSLSRIAFNETRTRALVEARLDTAVGSWGPATMMLLRKAGERWQIVVDDVGRDATSGEWDGDRCLPVKAPASLSPEAVDKIAGTFRVIFAETIGRQGDGFTLMRFSYGYPDRTMFGKPFSAQDRARSKESHLFEILNDGTEKPNDRASLGFWISGAGRDIGRKSGLMQLDGYSMWLNIRRVTASGFFGSWSAGVFGLSEFGHFCAVRVH
jgi:carboxypeptidase family protein